MNRLIVWLTPPAGGDDEVNQRAFTTHLIGVAMLAAGLLSLLVELAAGNPDPALPLAAGLVVALVGIWLNRRGRTRLASAILVGAILVVETVLVLIGQGIHDIGIMLYPMSMILISLLFDDRDAMVGYVLVIASVGFVVFSEMAGLLDAGLEDVRTGLADFIVISVILTVTGIGLRLIRGFLNRSLEQARQTAFALHTSEARFRSLTENAPDQVLNINEQGTVLYSNRTLLEPGEVLEGRSIYEYFPEEQHEVIKQIVADTFKTGKMATYEGRTLSARGQQPWCSFRLSPVREDGRVTSLVVTATNLQERKQLEESLQNHLDQLATINRIAAAISSLGDLRGVLDEILAQLKTVMTVDAFYVGLLDESRSKVSFPIVFDTGKRYPGNVTELSPGGWIAQVVNSRQPLLIIRTAEELERANLQHMMGDENRPSASIMMAPLVIEERTIGVVSAQSYSLNAYSQKQVDFLQNIATQIAIAVENARLYESLELRTEQLTSLNRIGAAIASLQEPEPLQQQVLEQLKASLPLDAFFVAFHHPAEKKWSFPLVYDSGSTWMEPEQKYDYNKNSRLAQVMLKGKSFLINRTAEDMATDPHDSMIGDETKVSASIMMVPLQVGKNILGAISVQSYTMNAYTEEHLAFLRSAANQVAVALENSRLYSELQSELIERERSETALRQSEARLRAIIENIPFDLWLCDTQGRYILQSSISDKLAGNILGMTVSDLNVTDDLKKTWAGMHQQALAGKIVREEGQWQVNGELHSFITQLAPVSDEGELLGFVGLNLDITDLMRSEEALRRYAARIETLHEIDQAILAVRSSREIAIAAISRLPRLVPCSSASLALMDVNASTAQVMAIYGEGRTQPGSDEIVLFRDSECLAQLVAGQAVYLSHLMTQPLDELPRLNRVLLQGAIHSAIVAPLRYKEKLVGTLSVGTEEADQLTQQDIAIVQEMAIQLAVAINQAQLNADIQRLNAELEARVQERTAQLQAAYGELESFSFSVSHDLRAPLRAVIGYLKLYIEDFGHKMEGEAQDYLTRIESSALRMNQLIDDLLALSRVGREALQFTRFSLEDLFRDVLQESSAGGSRERVQITLYTLPEIEADRNLMLLVCQNLVDNALKYSRNRPVSQVEIGCLEEPGKQVFYVRDNGVGFDMKYAHKLFKAFERLHSQDDFEGTGVGLAIVQRILQRHGGRIWADAALDQGATFYFTLKN